MNRMPPVLREAVDPTENERALLRPPPPAPSWCAEATAPEPSEVARLMARARSPRCTPTVRPALAWMLLAALFFLGLVHLVPMPVESTAPAAPLQATGPHVLTEGATLRFGPSIAVEGHGELAVMRADESSTELDLLEGEAWFEVDPQGPRRHLTVRAGDVTIEVTGTRFRVARDEEWVEVEVARGSVAIRRQAGSFTLQAGEHWSSIGIAAPPAPAPSGPTPRSESALARAAPAQLAPTPTPVSPPPSAEPSTVPDTSRAWAAILDHRAQGAAPEALVAEIDAFLLVGGDPALLAEAGVLRLQLLPGLFPGEEAMAAIDAWLRAHPGHSRTLELRYLRATVAREQLDDCDLALSDYVMVAAEASGTLRDRAEAWAEHCRTSRE